jgi:hypothetical protein
MTTAKSRRTTQLNWARYEARPLVNGCLVAADPTQPHGITSTYDNHGCRCAECKAANTRRQSANRARRRFV